MLKVRLLGSFQITYGAKPIEISSRPAQSLFAFLILHAGTAYRREKLAGQLWPDTPEESARDYLRHALWRIQKALKTASPASYIHADDRTIAFDSSQEYWLDAAKLEQLGESSTPDELVEALSGYRGELLPGVYDEWAVLEREHLQAVYEQQVEHLLDDLAGMQNWGEVQEWSERWISFGQKPEAAYRHLMNAHAARGDMSKAAAAFERCMKALAEYGVEPSLQTRQLYADLKAGKQVLRAPSRSVNRAPRPHPQSNVPRPLTSFVGREKELIEILRVLKSQRLLTLVGPGGVGKTRLAIEAAQRLTAKFADGVWWVDLVGLSDRGLVPQAVAQSADVHELSNQPLLRTLAEHFATRQSLLILDNCEHLIAACAEMAAGLLSASRNLRILATSREVLGVSGETTFAVPSLSLPDTKELPAVKSLRRFEGTSLFLERVAAAQSSFELTDRNASAVIQICKRLGGIPLAIELAAARAKMMSVEEIASRLDDSFELLTGGERTALPRHQTLRATIDWSYNLLSESERVLFRRLSVFAGGFTLEAAEQVAADQSLPRSQIISVLGQLINKSLVSARQASESETRYTMLETLREYSGQHVAEAGELSDLRERHLEYFTSFAARAGKNLHTGEEVVWFPRASEEIENLRLALSWPERALPREPEELHTILKQQFLIVDSLCDFWESRTRFEILESLSRLLAMDNANAPTIERGRALSTGGFLLWSLHRFREARAYLDESMRIADGLGDRLTLARSMSYLGWLCDYQGEYDVAGEYGRKSIEIARGVGAEASFIVAQSLGYLGDIPYWKGKFSEARLLYEQAASFMRESRAVNWLTYPVRRLGYICLYEREFAGALRFFSESLELNRQVGHLQGMVACLAGCAATHLAQGALEKAAILYGWVASTEQHLGAPFFYIDTYEFEHTSDQLRAAMREKALAPLAEKGRTLTLEAAIGLALGTQGTRASRRSPGRGARNLANTR